MVDYEKAVIFWRRRKIETDAELAEALNGHCIAFAYHSGRIENQNITYNDTREIFEHDGVNSYTGDLRTLFEIRNAKEANELLLTAFRDRRPLDEALLKEFQSCLTKSLMFRMKRYWLQPHIFMRNSRISTPLPTETDGRSKPGRSRYGVQRIDVVDGLNEIIALFKEKSR